MFENKIVKGCDIHYSRIIASWVNVGGSFRSYKDRELFKKWLKSTDILSDDQIDEITLMATNGKMEWEHSAELFIFSELM